MINSDEAHFDMNGFVNNQNCRIWAPEDLMSFINDHFIHIESQSGVLFGTGVIRPYFFEGAAGNSRTVTELN